jgi:nucleotide-binding universal stress UspA family protein
MVGCIVVGTDGSETAERAVSEAGDLAAGLGATVVVVTAFAPNGPKEPLGSSARQDPVHMEEVAANVARRAVGHLEARGVKADFDVRGGDPADVLIQIASEHNADLIIVGNQGLASITRFLLGSVPSKVVHHAPCSVMVVRTD